MFLSIGKFLYMDLKSEKLKMAEPANEMAELEKSPKKVVELSAKKTK